MHKHAIGCLYKNPLEGGICSTSGGNLPGAESQRRPTNELKRFTTSQLDNSGFHDPVVEMRGEVDQSLVLRRLRVMRNGNVPPSGGGWQGYSLYKV